MAAFSVQGRTCYHKPFTLKCKTCKKGKKEVIKVGCWDWTTDHQSEAVQNRRLNQLSYPGREVGAKNWQILELQPYTILLLYGYVPTPLLWSNESDLASHCIIFAHVKYTQIRIWSNLMFTFVPSSINRPLLWGVGMAISCKNVCNL